VVSSLTPSITLVSGPINGSLIHRDGKTLAVYGDPRENAPPVERVLFTHGRRDVVWAGRSLVKAGAIAIVPAADKWMFTDVREFWGKFYETGRFHDYSNQSTRILSQPFPAVTTVRGSNRIVWRGISIDVLDTPGYTRGAVSYLLDLDGKRIAFTGDLIYGDGKFLDLYTLQDALPDFKENGYHGYAARASGVIESLHKIAAWKPDLIVPVRGPVITNPPQAMQTVIRRMQAVFRSHFVIDAMRWTRGDDKINAIAARVLGEQPTGWMPAAETQPRPPQWIIPIANSRLILSKAGNAFLVDCGVRNVVPELRRLHAQGRFKNLEGIYITHYHDDHTDYAQAVAEEYRCPVYAVAEMRDILERPEAYRMPCLTHNAIRSVTARTENAKQRWNEFELTFFYFPGQTIYHGGLLLKKDSGERIFFVGDSFTPSGVDDYCLTNRNLLPPNKGFVYCLGILRKMGFDYQLINQHLLPTFHFSHRQIDFMLDTWKKRVSLLHDLFPWDDPNYGVDEQWARFYPYTSRAAAGRPLQLQVIVRNHSPKRQEYMITPHVPAGWTVAASPLKIRLRPRQEGSIAVPIKPAPRARGLSVVTADVSFGNWDLHEWFEALVSVQ